MSEKTEQSWGACTGYEPRYSFGADGDSANDIGFMRPAITNDGFAEKFNEAMRNSKPGCFYTFDADGNVTDVKEPQPTELDIASAERDALAAQVQMLKTALKEQCAVVMKNTMARPDKSDCAWSKAKEALDLCEVTPAACLAQVQAEAGRAGFVAALSMHGNPFQLTHSRIAELADQHAERIRQGVK